MNHDPLEKEQLLRTKLDEYQIDIPDLPMDPESNRWERFINILASPTDNPIEPIISTTNGFMFLKIAPIMGTAVVALIQVLLLL